MRCAVVFSPYPQTSTDLLSPNPGTPNSCQTAKQGIPSTVTNSAAQTRYRVTGCLVAEKDRIMAAYLPLGLSPSAWAAGPGRTKHCASLTKCTELTSPLGLASLNNNNSIIPSVCCLFQFQSLAVHTTSNPTSLNGRGICLVLCLECRSDYGLG